MNKKRWLLVTAMIIFVAIWNLPLSYRVGIDGRLFTKPIPLYAKACGYLYRDWAYKEIVSEIAQTGLTDQEKVLAIMRWVNEHIKSGVPEGLRAVDDHPLNIIIRQYGAKDQVEDVFTILCSYAGFEAGMRKCRAKDTGRATVLSFVKIKGRWFVFDAAKGRYFLKTNGEMADIDDVTRGDFIQKDGDAAIYTEYLKGLVEKDLLSFTRAAEQMPLRRPLIQLRKFFGSSVR